MIWQLIVGAIVICVVIGAIFGFLGNTSKGDNPVAGAAGGAMAGGFFGLQQGCGCAIMIGLAAIAIAVGKMIIG
jgi:hypothetical protein